MNETNRETEPLLASGNQNIRVPAISHVRVIALVATIVLISDLAGYAATAPQLQIFEDIICRQYYYNLEGKSNHTGQAVNCKIEPVQSELALINGWADTFQTIPGILLALPYGALADRIGRKPVLLLGMFGCLLGEIWLRLVCWFAPRLPIKAVWLSALSYIIGGGPQTATSILFVMMADVCSVERRTSAFSAFSAAVLISEAIATPISASLMSVSPWLPYMIAFAMSFVGLFVVLWLPETLKGKNVLTDDQRSINEDPESGHGFLTRLQRLKEVGDFVRKNLNVFLILLCFFVAYLGRQAIPLILQYGPKRFGWTIAKTSYFLSLRSGVNLLLLFVLLPAMSEFLTLKVKLRPSVRDKYLTMASFLLLSAGYIVIFLARSTGAFIVALTVCALGSSFQVPARSLITGLVEQNQLGTVYTGIAVVTSCGMMIAGPLLAYSFKWGMLLDGLWLAMPFLVTAILSGIGLVFVLLTRLDQVT